MASPPPSPCRAPTAASSEPAPVEPPAIDAGGWEGYPKGKARRDAIIRTATEQFAQRGFGNATVRDIAAACGISRAGLVHYFRDKEALLQAVLEDRDLADRARFQPYVGFPGGIGILRGMVDLAGHNQLVPGLIDLFVRLSAEASDPAHPAHDYFVRRYRRIRRGTVHALREARGAGYLGPEREPDRVAVQLTALMDGLQTQWQFDRTINLADHLHSALFEVLTAAGRDAFDRAAPKVESA